MNFVHLLFVSLSCYQHYLFIVGRVINLGIRGCLIRRLELFVVAVAVAVYNQNVHNTVSLLCFVWTSFQLLANNGLVRDRSTTTKDRVPLCNSTTV